MGDYKLIAQISMFSVFVTGTVRIYQQNMVLDAPVLSILSLHFLISFFFIFQAIHTNTSIMQGMQNII
jgi:hypothetical protein